MVEIGQTLADDEGHYTIKAAPTSEMRRAAAANHGWLNFYVSGYSPSTGMATTMLVSRQVAGGSFLTPTPPSKSETLDSSVLRQKPAPRTARAAERRASLDDENPAVLASVAPEANLALTVETTNSPETPASARKRVSYCKFNYGANTQTRQCVVEFHNAGNSTGRWVYGQNADSDIEGGIKYPGGGYGQSTARDM